jgi:hypothetical protein
MKITEVLLLTAALLGGAVLSAENAAWFGEPGARVALWTRDSACQLIEGRIECEFGLITIAGFQRSGR